MSGLLKKKNEICLLKSKFEVICEQFLRAVKRMSVRLFIKIVLVIIHFERFCEKY